MALGTRPVVVADSDVLYKSAVRDFVFEFAIAEKIRLHWSTETHSEVLKNLQLADLRFESTFSRNSSHLVRAFPDTLVSSEPAHDLPDVHAKDVHVAQAAIELQASVILTFNLKDFSPSEHLSRAHISVLTPDLFFGAMYRSDELAFLQTVSRLLKDFRNPPMTGSDFARFLEKAGCPAISSILRDENQVLSQLSSELG